MNTTTLETQVGPGSFLDLFSTAGDIRISEIPSGRGRRFFVSLDAFTAEKVADLSAEPVSRDAVIQNAQILMAAGEMVLARTLYSFLLKHNVRDQEALKGLGICLLKIGQHNAARKCLMAYADISKQPDAQYWLGMLAVHEKDDQNAVIALSRGLEATNLSQEQRVEGLKEIGSAQLRIGNLDQAEQSYKKALELDVNSDALSVNLGTLEHHRGRLESAKRWFEKALLSKATSYRALCGLGMIAVTEGKRSEAWTQFVRALEIESRFGLAAQELVSLAESPAQVTFAKAKLHSILEREPAHADARYSLAALLFKEGAWTECQREVATTLKNTPGHLGANRLRELLVANRHLK